MVQLISHRMGGNGQVCFGSYDQFGNTLNPDVCSNNNGTHILIQNITEFVTYLLSKTRR